MLLLRQLWPWPFFTRFDHFIPHNGKLRAERKKKPPRLCSWSFNRNFLQVKRYCGTLFGCAAEASQLHLQAVQMPSLASMTSDIKIRLADIRSNKQGQRSLEMGTKILSKPSKLQIYFLKVIKNQRPMTSFQPFQETFGHDVYSCNKITIT